MLHTKVTRKSSIVVGSPSLGKTSWTIDLVRAFLARSLVICSVPIFCRFPALIRIWCTHGLPECRSDMHLNEQVNLLYQMEARTVTHIPEVDTNQTIPLVLPHLTGRGEQREITPDVTIVGEIRLDRFGGYMSYVRVHGKVWRVHVVCPRTRQGR